MGNFYWAICHHCDGHGSMDNPAFSDGFTNSELYDIEPEERQRIVNGAYDVLCTTCKGSGKVKVPNIREMSFGEKRALGIWMFSWSGYVVSPGCCRYLTGLIAPNDILIRFSLYQRM
ncbi:TPA: hypothetical protein ACNVML_005023 [Klebsiella pneumoniae]|uniref:hypothetical protein n=1 Tax=Klebsiella aerogenes TaxID=548 RepID=UPI002FF823AA